MYHVFLLNSTMYSIYSGYYLTAIFVFYYLDKQSPGREFLLRVSYLEIYNEVCCLCHSKEKKDTSVNFLQGIPLAFALTLYD
jgi:hypothetical protein